MAPITKLFFSAILASYVLAAPVQRRQLAGEGAAANSILTDTDNGVGYGTENAEDNAASLITSVKPAARAARQRRQLDKIVNGAGAVCTAAGGNCGNQVSSLDSIDGAATSGAADTGAAVGSTEETSLEAAGSAVPSSA